MIDNNENNEWQPATVNPIEKMCNLHRKLLLLERLSVQQTRADYVGRRVEIQLSHGIHSQGIPLPEGDCLPIRIKNEDGKVCGGFSCDVSTD
jgi:hypothetical protein